MNESRPPFPPFDLPAASQRSKPRRTPGTPATPDVSPWRTPPTAPGEIETCTSSGETASSSSSPASGNTSRTTPFARALWGLPRRRSSPASTSTPTTRSPPSPRRPTGSCSTQTSSARPSPGPACTRTERSVPPEPPPLRTRVRVRRIRWSWGESNPRPPSGCRPRYDHSRDLRLCGCRTAGSVGLAEEAAAGSFPDVSGLSRRQRSFPPPTIASVAGLRWSGPACHHWSLVLSIAWVIRRRQRTARRQLCLCPV
jgi:hypothetical protein